MLLRPARGARRKHPQALSFGAHDELDEPFGHAAIRRALQDGDGIAVDDREPLGSDEADGLAALREPLALGIKINARADRNLPLGTGARDVRGAGEELPRVGRHPHQDRHPFLVPVGLEDDLVGLADAAALGGVARPHETEVFWVGHRFPRLGQRQAAILDDLLVVDQAERRNGRPVPAELRIVKRLAGRRFRNGRQNVVRQAIRFEEPQLLHPFVDRAATECHVHIVAPAEELVLEALEHQAGPADVGPGNFHLAACLAAVPILKGRLKLRADFVAMRRINQQRVRTGRGFLAAASDQADEQHDHPQPDGERHAVHGHDGAEPLRYGFQSQGNHSAASRRAHTSGHG